MLAINPISIAQDLQVQLQKLKNDLFNGSFAIGTKYNKQLQWKFYFRLGHISWVSGGLNSSERWQRHIKLFCSKLEPKYIKRIVAVQEAIQEYQVLAQLQEKNLLTKEKISDLVTSIVTEALFDVMFYGSIENHKFSYNIAEQESLGATLYLIEPLDAIAKSQALAKEWIEADLGEYSPNLHPVIKQPELLVINGKLTINLQILPLINGRLSLRGLASHTKQNLIYLTQSLIPFVDNGTISFSWVPNPQKLDLSEIKLYLKQSHISNKPQNNSVKKTKSVIACVDDSPLVCEGFKKIFNDLGYSFLGIQDPLQAIPLLLKKKPDFIFLDLIMPVTNGYELCSQLRKIPAFQDIPIIMLAVKNNLTDRIRAKIVHSNGFIVKPARKDLIIDLINKYLPKESS
ncbi:MAG: response regulator [Xenococcus sp. (in: cyanobacteria)]